MVCTATEVNSCGGCIDLVDTPGDACASDCGVGTLVCAGDSAVACDAPLPNGCGTCTTLDGQVGDPCDGDCPSAGLQCNGAGTALVCVSDPFDICGGCSGTDAALGQSCATGVCESAWVCEGTNLTCESDATNPCGLCGGADINEVIG
ncbi:MAG: hypothetical protein ACI81R_001106, partial [Bradymonadia bacterium]